MKAAGIASIVAPASLSAAIEVGEAQIVADRKAERPDRRVDHHRPLAAAIGGRFAPALAGRQVDVEQMDLVVAGADLALVVDHEAAIDELAAVLRRASASEPRWTQMPASAAASRTAASTGSSASLRRCAAARVAVAVEQAAHLRREQHRRAAGRRLVDRARPARRHWRPDRSRSAPG